MVAIVHIAASTLHLYSWVHFCLHATMLQPTSQLEQVSICPPAKCSLSDGIRTPYNTWFIGQRLEVLPEFALQTAYRLV